MKGPHHFTRQSDEIRTVGIDYGPKILVIAEKGFRMLWKVPGHNVWAGNYQPWKFWGTEYMAVELMEDGRGNVVRQEQPGKHWRPVVAELRAWVEEAQ